MCRFSGAIGIDFFSIKYVAQYLVWWAEYVHADFAAVCWLVHCKFHLTPNIIVKLNLVPLYEALPSPSLST